LNEKEVNAFKHTLNYSNTISRALPLLSHYLLIPLFSLSYTYYTSWLIRTHSMIHLIHRIILNPPLDLDLVWGIRPLVSLGGDHSTLILMLLILDIYNKTIGGVKRSMN
jgi:hypothetical protein